MCSTRRIQINQFHFELPVMISSLNRVMPRPRPQFCVPLGPGPQDQGQARVSKLLHRLDSLDGRRDGKVDVPTLRKCLFHLERRQDFEVVLELIHEADTNHDGVLDRDELKAFIQRLTQHSEATQDQRGTERKTSGVHLEHLQSLANAERYRCWPPPWLILTITISEIGFFIFHVLHFLYHPAHSNNPNISVSWEGPYQKCSKLIFNPSRRYELWRYISYILVHAGLSHLLTNVILQVIVGVPLEMAHGWIRVGLIYGTGIVAGSLTTSVLKPAQYLAGSSGSVFALIGAHLASMVLNWREDRVVVRERLRGTFWFSSKTRSMEKAKQFRYLRLAFVIILCGLDFGRPLWSSGTSNGVIVSFTAHLGGLVSGFLLGLIVLRNRQVEEWERVIKLLSAIVLSILAFIGVVWSVLGNDILQTITSNDKVRYFAPIDTLPMEAHISNCTYEDYRII